MQDLRMWVIRCETLGKVVDMKKAKELFLRFFLLIYVLAVIVAIILFVRWRCNVNARLVTGQELNEIESVGEINAEQVKIDLSVQNERHVAADDYSFISERDVFLEKQVEMTFYLPTGNACANTEMPQENHTVAFDRNYLNCECDIYTLHGELIGHYVIDDTGYGRTEENGKGTIQNGNCVDVFFETESDGWEFIEEYGNEVIVKIYERED